MVNKETTESTTGRFCSESQNTLAAEMSHHVGVIPKAAFYASGHIGPLSNSRRMEIKLPGYRFRIKQRGPLSLGISSTYIFLFNDKEVGTWLESCYELTEIQLQLPGLIREI